MIPPLSRLSNPVAFAISIKVSWGTSQTSENKCITQTIQSAVTYLALGLIHIYEQKIGE